MVDTPGIRQFGFWDVIPEELEAFFIEFRPFLSGLPVPRLLAPPRKQGAAFKRPFGLAGSIQSAMTAIAGCTPAPKKTSTPLGSIAWKSTCPALPSSHRSHIPGPMINTAQGSIPPRNDEGTVR